MDDVTRLLADLVAIPSVNPMGRALAGPEVLETRLTGYLEDWFGRNGIPASRQPVAPGRDNLLARFESPGSRRTMLFDVHQDTVPTDGMTIDPFRATDRGRAAVRPGLVRHQGGDGGHARGRRAALPRAAAPGRLGRAGLHGRRGVHPHGLVAAGRDSPRRRPGRRRRADSAGPGPLPQGGIAMEDPDPGRGLPQLDAAPGESTPSTGWAGCSTLWPSTPAFLAQQCPTRSSARPACRSAGSRGGRASTSFPTGARSRSIGDLIPGEEPEQSSASDPAIPRRPAGEPGGHRVRPPWVNMPALVPRLETWVEPLQGGGQAGDRT